jgi:5-hydroxyisourate hydrolase
MSAITTHVLDTARGQPAAGIPVRLEALLNGAWQLRAEGVTNEDGRLRILESSDHGEYRIVFDVGDYLGNTGFYREIAIQFIVRDDRHHHVPLLLSPFGYSTYKGS